MSLSVLDPVWSRVSTIAASSGATRGYRIGAVEVSLTTGLRDVASAFHGLYSTFAVETPPPGAIRIGVERSWSALSRGAYRITVDGEDRFALRRRRSILPHVEWAINSGVAASLPRFFQIHAGVVAREGAGLILPANPQSGKSTLVARLVARGWDYLSDEFALLDPLTLRLAPYPKAICVKQGSFGVLERFGVRLDRYPEYDKGAKGRVRLIDAQHLRPHRTPADVAVKWIVFPRYADRKRPVVRTVSRAYALFQLLNVSFTFARFRARALALAESFVRNAGCFQIETGEIDAACDAIESLVGEGKATSAPAFEAHGQGLCRAGEHEANHA